MSFRAERGTSRPQREEREILRYAQDDTLRPLHWSLGFGHWSLTGHWDLVIGHHTTRVSHPLRYGRRMYWSASGALVAFSVFGSHSSFLPTR